MTCDCRVTQFQNYYMDSSQKKSQLTSRFIVQSGKIWLRIVAKQIFEEGQIHGGPASKLNELGNPSGC
jgi:hypothetical protein